ncbi:hypothetical protein ACFE04_002068 [Oxalis oulophora]
MEHKTWLWKKKSTQNVNELLKQHEQEILELRAEKVELENEVKTLTDKLSVALLDCDDKEEQVTKNADMACQATAGWEVAKEEIVSLRQELDKALQQRLIGEERISQLDSALKECMQQLGFVRNEQEKRIHDTIMKATRQFENSRMILEEKLAETSKRLAKVVTENTNLTKAMLSKEKSIDDLNKQKGNSEADLTKIMSQLYSLEKDNNSLKYEVRVLEKEVQIRNEDREFNRRTADASHRQYLDSAKKIAKLESECQRLRILVRKRLPGPAAFAKMKNEVEILGRESVNMRRRSLQKSESLSSLTEQLRSLEEENKNLKDALVKKIQELQFSRTMYARAASKLSEIESQLEEIAESPSCKTNRGSDISLMDDFVEMEKLAVFSVDNTRSRSCLSTNEVVSVSVSGPMESESSGSSSHKKGVDKSLESEKSTEVANLEHLAVTSDSYKSGQLSNQLQDSEEKKELSDKLTNLDAKDGGLEEAVYKSGKLSNQVEGSEKATAIQFKLARETSRSEMKHENNHLRSHSETTTASENLAKCQETILNLGKQMKALASSPSDASNNTVSSTATDSPKNKLTNERSTLLDRMLAEDNGVTAKDDKSPKSNESTNNALTGPSFDGEIQHPEKIVFVNVSANSLAMVPRENARNVSLWRKLVST